MNNCVWYLWTCPKLEVYVVATAVSAGKGPFCQQNITPDRKLFVTQSKHIIFWSNKKFFKAYDLLISEEKLSLILGMNRAGSALA